MKLSRTALKELNARYLKVLTKCLYLNAGVIASCFLCMEDSWALTPINLGTVTLNGESITYKDNVYEMPTMFNSGSISFVNAQVVLTEDWYGGGINYSFDENSIVDLRSGAYEKVEFDNMGGNGATLAFDIVSSTSADNLYLSPTYSYSFKFDPTKISFYVADGTFGTVRVLAGNAIFDSNVKGKSFYTVSDGVAHITTVQEDLQQIGFDYKGAVSGQSLADLNQYNGTGLFVIENQRYKPDTDLGVTGLGEKTIKGVGENAVLDASGEGQGLTLFKFTNTSVQGQQSTLLVEDLKIKDAKTVLSSQSGVGNVRFKNVQIIGDNEGLIENGSDLIVENSTIKTLTNTGTATLTNTNVTRALTVASGSVSLRSETPENLVEVKGLTTVSSVLDIKGAGTVVLNGVDGTGQINNAGNLVFKSKNQNEPISLQLDQDSSFLSLKNEGNSTIDSGQNFFKDVVNTGTLVNNSEMIVSSNFKTNNLAGNGTITMAQGSVLNVPPEFETTNNLISKGMLFGENVEKVTVSDLTIAENSTLDIKNIDVTANNLLMAENSVLKVTLNGFSDYGTISGETIHALEGASLQFNFGNDFSGGVYQILNFSEIISLPLIQNINGLYTFIDLKDGRYSFEQKNNVEELSKLGATRNDINTISALMEEGGNNSSFNEVQRKMKELIQSGELSQIQSAIKASKSLSSNISTVAVSQNMEQFQSLFGAVLSQTEQFEKETGRAGGDETPRSSVWTKAFYSKTKKSGQNDYKTKGTGGILGIQTKVTDDLVIGIGYAYSQADVKQSGRDTDINNNLGFGYFRYQPSGWFVDGLFSYSRGRYEEDKYVLSSHGSADYNVESIAVQSMVGYDYAYKNILLMPKVGLRYMNVTQESYTDTFGTYVGNSSSDYITVMAGVDVKSPYKTVNNFHIRPVGALLLGYDLKTDDMKGVNTLSNGATYVVEGDALARFSWNVKAGIEAELSEKTILKLEYSGSFRSSYQDHGGMLKVEYRF